MLETVKHFFAMGGYARYVWPAYGCVFAYMIVQAFNPWRRWRKFNSQLPKKTRRY